MTKNNKPSLLDLMLADKTLEPTSIEYISPLGKGDHTIIQAKIDLWTTKRCKEGLNYNKGSYVKHQHEESQTLEQDWENFKFILDCAVKKFIPKTKIREKNKMPMRPEVRDAVREKQKLGEMSREIKH